MPRTHYATHLDVLRHFDPTLTQSDLNNNNYVGQDDEEIITARLEGVEAQFERETGTALRQVRQGSEGDPATYEHLTAKRGSTFPVTYSLEHRNVLPIDSSQGDAIEVRTARDNWRDITGDEGSRWVLIDNRNGKLEFYSKLRHSINFRPRPGTRFIRLTYRHGALGGSHNGGGETTLGASLSQGATPNALSVGDASRLPAGGGTLLLGGDEYVRVGGVDQTNDEIDIGERGLRRTSDTSHSSGDVIHYCPLNVRDAIAAKAAEELVRHDDYTTRLSDDDLSVDPQTRLESWSQQYERIVAQFNRWYYS